MSKKTLRPVMFDIDGVLADFMHGYLRVARTLGHDVELVSHEDIVSWNQFSFVGAWNKIHRAANFWCTLPALLCVHTFNRIEELQKRRPVYFVTSRPHTADIKHQTALWLDSRGISNPSVIITPSKGQIAAAIGAAYLLDDKAGNAVYTAYESPKTKAFLLDRKYNQFNPDVIGSKVQRVKSVEAFLDIVEVE